MSDLGLTAEKLKAQHDSDIDETRTFRTHGVSELSAIEYLDTPEGTRYIEMLVDADPSAHRSKIAERAIDQIISGRELPRMETIDEPLVKIVPRGEPVPPYSPFFARQSAFEDAIAKDHNLSDYFGLPIRSEAAGLRYPPDTPQYSD